MTLEERFNKLKQYYIEKSEVCMVEMLASTKAGGMSIEDAFYMYIALMEWAEGDEFYIKRFEEDMKRIEIL